MSEKPSPADVIDPSWLPTYERQRDAIWNQLTMLDTKLFLLEKLAAFPFKLFLQPADRIFWQYAQNALSRNNHYDYLESCY